MYEVIVPTRATCTFALEPWDGVYEIPGFEQRGSCALSCPWTASEGVFRSLTIIHLLLCPSLPSCPQTVLYCLLFILLVGECANHPRPPWFDHSGRCRVVRSFCVRFVHEIWLLDVEFFMACFVYNSRCVFLCIENTCLHALDFFFWKYVVFRVVINVYFLILEMCIFMCISMCVCLLRCVGTPSGGVVTPGAVLVDSSLVDRLGKEGVTFEVVEQTG